MTAVPHVSELHMSGARAVLKLESGKKLDEDALAEAFEKKGMELASVDRTRRPRAARTYLVDAGIT